MTGAPLAATVGRDATQDRGRAGWACLKAAKAACLSIGEWAREHGIDGRSLNAWHVNLSRGGAKPKQSSSTPRLIELVPASPPRVEARYLVRIAGAELEVTDGFHEETLVRLVRALRSC